MLGLIEPKQKQTQWKRQKEMSNRKKRQKKGEKRQKKDKKKRNIKKSNKGIWTNKNTTNGFKLVFGWIGPKTKTKMNGRQKEWIN